MYMDTNLSALPFATYKYKYNMSHNVANLIEHQIIVSVIYNCLFMCALQWQGIPIVNIKREDPKQQK